MATVSTVAACLASSFLRLSLGLGILAVPSLARAAATDFARALGVATSLEGLDRTAILAAGETFIVHVKTDGFQVMGQDGFIALQFKVVVDPRLEVVARYTTPEALLEFHPQPEEWILGLQDCAGVGDHPYTPASYEVRIGEGVTDVSNLRIDVGPLSHEPMMYSPCLDPVHLGLFSNAGGVLLNPATPSVVHFSGEHERVSSGSSTTLAWETFGATTALLDGVPVPVTGRSEVSPASSHTYVLEVSDAQRTVAALRTVLVDDSQVEIASFMADPEPVFGGFPTTLSWQTDPDLDLIIEPDVGAVAGPSGSVEVTPTREGVVYVLSATGPAGTASRAVSIGWQPPMASLAASDGPPHAGVTLTATVEGALTASLEPGFGPIDPTGGTFQVVVTEPTTFVLTATNLKGSVTSEVTLEPRPPDVSLTASNEHPALGEIVTLTATITGADAASLEPGFGAIDPTGGEFQVEVIDPVLYVLTATNSVGTTTAELHLEPSPPMVAITASASEVLAGTEVDLTVSLVNAASASLQPGFGSIDPAGGVFTTPVEETTTFVATAVNSVGTASAEVTVATLPFHIVSFGATPTQIEPGDNVTLSWNVLGQADVTLEGLGSVPMSGTLDVQPQVTTTYVLRAENGSDIRTASATVQVGTANALVFSWDAVEIPGMSPPVAPLLAFDVYVVATGLTHDLAGYEFSLDAPACLIILAANDLTNPGGSISVGTAPFEWVVGIGQCVPGPQVALVRLHILAVEQSCLDDAELSFGPANPSSFQPPTPGYLNCQGSLFSATAGPPYPLWGDPVVPAIVLDLRAEANPTGIELTWTLQGAQPASLTLLRAAEDGPFAELVTLPRPGSRGSWTDASGVDRRARYLALAEIGGQHVASEPVAFDGAVATPGSQTRLLPNRPNPFHPATELSFHLARAGDARIEIFDSLGRRVRTFLLPGLRPGDHFVPWNSEDSNGHRVASGVYSVRLQTPSGQDVRRITLLR